MSLSLLRRPGPTSIRASRSQNSNHSGPLCQVIGILQQMKLRLLRGAVRALAVVTNNQARGGEREYKNAVGFVLPDPAAFDRARACARLVLASRLLLEKLARYDLKPEQVAELQDKERSADRDRRAAVERRKSSTSPGWAVAQARFTSNVERAPQPKAVRVPLAHFVAIVSQLDGLVRLVAVRACTLPRGRMVGS